MPLQREWLRVVEVGRLLIIVFEGYKEIAELSAISRLPDRTALSTTRGLDPTDGCRCSSAIHSRSRRTRKDQWKVSRSTLELLEVAVTSVSIGTLAGRRIGIAVRWF